MKAMLPLAICALFLAGSLLFLVGQPDSGGKSPNGAILPAAPVDLSPIVDRLQALEDRLDVIELRLAERPPLAASSSMEQSLVKKVSPSLGSQAEGLDQEDVELAHQLDTMEPSSDVAVLDTLKEEMQERVDAAVDKKATEFMIKMNKKPEFDDFAQVLELTDHQRWAIEKEVIAGQEAKREILETPMLDGTNFVEEIVEAWAQSSVNPGREGGRAKAIYGRLWSETFPGSTETYAERMDAAEDSVRDAFRRELNDDQYAEFEDWGLDPTEVQGIAESPWRDIKDRVGERAQELRSQGSGSN